MIKDIVTNVEIFTKTTSPPEMQEKLMYKVSYRDGTSEEFTNEQFNIIAQLSEILANDDELEVGEFNLGIFKITVNKIKTVTDKRFSTMSTISNFVDKDIYVRSWNGGLSGAIPIDTEGVYSSNTFKRLTLNLNQIIIYNKIYH